ncbi:stage V sporulation protein AC [Caldinitratiruptor microaerophilus]|uniref:Stage V sporulation protein AC n=1 Tax=Caldinitratiruptor microaerophilus TaxID=671077 RepID=A0AA35G981_9FIRM|nr:stage V sporulation protein AC [Caldinitratiruptor microaerophilus]BDG60019.1 stage V sporulation protein AC [Caldinitratiruptor microaerophilus]
MAKKPRSAEQVRYHQLVSAREPRPPRLRNALMAFGVGGLVSVLGQALTDFYRLTLGLDKKAATGPAVVTLIFVAALLTGLGVFDRLAKYAGAGLAVPVTGFANSIAASALEFKREGLVQGVGSKMFMLAGSVITFGVVTAFVVALLATLIPG